VITIVQYNDDNKGTTVIVLEETGTKFVLECPWPDLVRYHDFGVIKGVVTSPQFPDGMWVVEVDINSMVHVTELFQKLLLLAQKENNNNASSTDQVRD
jgi:hypothetical protein